MLPGGGFFDEAVLDPFFFEELRQFVGGGVAHAEDRHGVILHGPLFAVARRAGRLILKSNCRGTDFQLVDVGEIQGTGAKLFLEVAEGEGFAAMRSAAEGEDDIRDN